METPLLTREPIEHASHLIDRCVYGEEPLETDRKSCEPYQARIAAAQIELLRET